MTEKNFTEAEIMKALYSMYCATAYKDTITMDNLFENDITWCYNQACKFENCFRNQKNLKPVATGRLLTSIAQLEGTEYCLKAKKSEEEK